MLVVREFSLPLDEFDDLAPCHLSDIRILRLVYVAVADEVLKYRGGLVGLV